MNIVDELNNEFSKQKSLYKVGQQPVAELEKYKIGRASCRERV